MEQMPMVVNRPKGFAWGVQVDGDNACAGQGLSDGP